LTPIIHGKTTLGWSGQREISETPSVLRKRSPEMKPIYIPLLALGAALLPSTTLVTPSNAETIACAAEVPAGGKGHWYYRLIDGRKCWYQGKPMMPKTSLHWPDSSTAEAEPVPPDNPTAASEPAESQRAASEEQAVATRQVAAPTTDGRGASAPPPAAQPVAWPAPAGVNEISFESRWLGLHSKN
jgi:hypothetical protein